MKSWLKVATLMVACAAALVGAGSALAQGKTNVLTLMIDDLDQALYDTALANGLMPNVQRSLVDAGTSFPQSFVTTPLCCPARSTYLTGQYAHNHGVYRNAGPFGGFKAFSDESTLATWLSDAGYRTGHIGKYLNGYANAGYVPPGWQSWRATTKGTNCMYDYSISENGRQRTYGSTPQEYQTDVFASYAEEFLRVADTRPFFLNVAISAPHDESCLGASSAKPYGEIRPAPRHVDTPDVVLPAGQLASFNEADMSDKPGWMRSIAPVDLAAQTVLFNEKLASLRAVDDLVGRMVATLRDIGRERSTAVIFMGDNGQLYGSHRLGEKAVVYEESIRVPLVIHHPGQVRSRVADEWALNTDWAPTIVQFTGATAGLPPDGRSLVPLVRGETVPTWRSSFLVEQIFDGEPAMLRPPYAALRSKDPALYDHRRSGTMLYVETSDPLLNTLTDLELYDMRLDPLQLASLHRSNSALRRQQMQAMKVRLGQLQACGGGSCQVLEE